MSTNMFKAALTNASRIAVRDIHRNINFSYTDLLCHANRISQQMNVSNVHGSITSSSSSYPPRVNLLIPPSFEYVASTYAVWSNNCISVPLCTSHPIAEMSYYVNDCESSLIIAHNTYSDITIELSKLHNNIPYIIIDDLNNNELNNIETEEEALNYGNTAIETVKNDHPSVFIYTSGTTSSPKGVVHSHDNIWNNIRMLSDEWKWSCNDSILNVLPMHHIHGLVNITFSALASGATVTFDKPNPLNIWNNFQNLNDLNVFMAVPTIYSKLIETFNDMSDEEQSKCIEACNKFRLMVSGSAALPNSVMNKWHNITNHWLLERYGMTEILMATTNPYNGFRKPGTVGFPMNGVETKIVDDELYIKTPCMFNEYYNKPDKTREEFTSDGWFKTNDCVEIDNDGYYRIFGRKNIDIISYAGYKLSAIDIERGLCEHDNIAEVVVVGITDETYGEIPAAIVRLKDKNKEFNLNIMRKWAKNQMAKYKIPQLLIVVDEIPKNVMGKVAKKTLINIFFTDDNDKVEKLQKNQ